MRQCPVVVLKFGSSVLRSEEDLPQVVHEVYRWIRDGYRVLAVVSAFGSRTDELFAQARQYSDRPDHRSVAALVATGEATAAALLSLAFDRAGVSSELLDADRVALRTRGPVLDADPFEIDCSEIDRLFERCSVAILPGFVGRDESGCLSLLGRGGSDLTALFVSLHLRADHCRLIKDVDGLFDLDPAEAGTLAKKFETITWEDALTIDADVVQRKSLEFAQQHELTFEVSALGSARGTLVGSEATTLFTEIPLAQRPLKIGLLGLGTVGFGVYRALVALPHLFQVTRIAVLNPAKHQNDVPAHLLTSNAWDVVRDESDVIVELIGGENPAQALIADALRIGKHVITANKLVVAEHGLKLSGLAEASGVELSFSAAVGGAVPMLEAVKQFADSGRIKLLRGVVNGTTTFVLDKVAHGASFQEALDAARSFGLAEADATLDLDGTDAAHKLVLLARAAFGVELELAGIERIGIQDLNPEYVRSEQERGNVIRLVGSLSREHDGQLSAKVEPQSLSSNDPLSETWAERCCLSITFTDDTSLGCNGKGAGRWPTTESVMADLFALLRKDPLEVQLGADQLECAGGVQ